MTKKKKKRKKRVKNGELTQLANGHWQGRVAVGRTETGPMYQQTKEIALPLFPARPVLPIR